MSLGGYLNEDPRISCYDPAYVRLKGEALFVGYFYLFLVLAVFLLLAYGFAPAKAVFAFMLDGYRETSLGRSWEALALLRKALLLGIPTGFTRLRDGRAQSCLSLLLLTATLSLHIVAQPFEQPVMNALDFLSLVAAIAVALSVATRVSAAMSSGYGVNAWEALFFDVTALVMCVPFIVFWLFLIVDSLLFDGFMVVAARLRLARAVAAVHGSTRRWGEWAGARLEAGAAACARGLLRAGVARRAAAEGRGEEQSAGVAQKQQQLQAIVHGLLAQPAGEERMGFSQKNSRA